MANRKRVKRDEPTRAGPVRNRATGKRAGRAAPVAGDDGFTVGTVVDESLRTAFRTVRANDATIRGAVERGVDTAYTVIEEYMLRGRQAAGRHHERKNGSSDMGDERNYRRNGFPGGGEVPPLLEPWMQMMRMWTDTLSAFVPGVAGFPNPFAPPRPSSHGGPRPSVAVQVSSRQPAEVTVNIDPGAEGTPLSADPLMHSDRGVGSTIDDYTVECRDGHVRVRLSVPDAQPAGTYEADLRDTDGTRRGSIRVQIHGTPAASVRQGGLRSAQSSAAKPKRARKPPATPTDGKRGDAP